MRITELFTAQSIALDEALQTQEQILSRLVELQATHGNITDKEAYKKALYAREAEGSTYVDNGITVPHAKTNVVTRPSLAALRLSTPVQYNAEDDGTTDPENYSAVVKAMEEKGYEILSDDLAMVPMTTTRLTDPDQLKLMGKLLNSAPRLPLTWRVSREMMKSMPPL